MRIAPSFFMIAILGMLIGGTPTTAADNLEVRWLQQFGTEGLDQIRDVAVDSEGDVYVAGEVSGALPGQQSVGLRDMFLRKYNGQGGILWTRQFGTPGPDFVGFAAGGLAVDETGVYVAGYVPVNPDTPADFDAFLRKYDADGNELWSRRFGTPGFDDLHDIASDGGSVYVVGSTDVGLPGEPFMGVEDSFVRKYTADGIQLWTRQFGTVGDDHANAIAIDSKGVYVAGFTTGALPGYTNTGGFDAFVRRYSADGVEEWTRQFGTEGTDLVSGLAADTRAVWAVGVASGALPGETFLGGEDAFVRMYTNRGDELWTDEFGTPGLDRPGGVDVRQDGTVLVPGGTSGPLSDQPFAGVIDCFVRAYGRDGIERWTLELGSLGLDACLGAAWDHEEASYAGGFTNAALPGQVSAGGRDAFIAKIAE